MQRFATAIIMNSSLLLFPMFVTAFGDIITWEENAYVGIVQYNIQDLDIICKGMDLFVQYLDNEYITKNLNLIYIDKLCQNMVLCLITSVSVLCHSWH